jgi:hypothetical protein
MRDPRLDPQRLPHLTLHDDRLRPSHHELDDAVAPAFVDRQPILCARGQRQGASEEQRSQRITGVSCERQADGLRRGRVLDRLSDAHDAALRIELIEASRGARALTQQTLLSHGHERGIRDRRQHGVHFVEARNPWSGIRGDNETIRRIVDAHHDCAGRHIGGAVPLDSVRGGFTGMERDWPGGRRLDNRLLTHA